MQTSSSQVPYQGYPYVKPPVTDVPSVDPAVAARWANLPRRQISAGPSTPPVLVTKRDPPTSGLERRDEPFVTRAAPIPPEASLNPVVYIDLPEDGGNDVTEPREERRPQYNQTQPSTSSTPSSAKPEPNDTPVVYIELPDAGGSDVSQSNDRRDEPEFVQETIFYDPFDNKTINVAGPSTAGPSNPRNLDRDVESGDSPRILPPPRRPRIEAVDLAGSSGVANQPLTPIATIQPTFDSYMKPMPESNLPASLPASAFREPPPAYSAYDMARTPTPITEQPIQAPPTQVILPGATVGTFNTDRQYLKCHHCNMQVHTLVVKEVGILTHLLALLCLFMCMIPCVVLIYCMDFFKNKNHLCPNCNKVIGYELPMKTKKILCVN